MKPAILVMDDEYVPRLLLGKILGKKFDVILKENGKEGINWINEGNIPNLVITDQFMPEADGYEFLKFIKSKEGMSGIPVVIITAMESAEERNKYLSLGASDFMEKPLDADRLTEVIERLLNRG